MPSLNPPNVVAAGNTNGYPGLPYVSIVRDTQSSFINLPAYFVRFDGQYVMEALQVEDFNNTNSTPVSAFIQSIIPNYQLKHIYSMINLVLAAGNDLPAQNWAGWFLYGFGFSAYPLNVALMVAGIILAIYQYRKV